MNHKTAYLMFAGLAILALAATGQAAAIAHYTFDTDFTDSSASGNDLTTAAGTPTITDVGTEKKFGDGALDLDSTTNNEEYLSLDSPLTFGALDAWSVSFWARRRPGTDDRSGMVMGNHTNSTDFIWVSMGQFDGLRYRNSSGSNAAEFAFTDDSQWHHWVVIADGAGNVEGYRDDIYQGSNSATTTFSITDVGQGYNSTVQSMDGQIDELWIFNEAIDADTVHSLFTTNTVPEPATMALLAIGSIAAIRRRRRQA